ncbi:MAG: aminotransferase class IV [Bacteroidales bacterium]|jgi:4-amino-4-deoxychorismate lyase|nr:aminotransferase class IV [Bacteroidales bacterium]
MSFNETFPLLESILLIDGQFPLLDYHQARMDYATENLFGIYVKPSLRDWINAHPYPVRGKYKCRILYGKRMQQPNYQVYYYKPVKKLQLIKANRLSYKLKFTDRAALNYLHQLKREADDVLIVQNDLITDTTYCNIAFRYGNEWFTPANPLLKGVQRAFLLDQGLLKAADLKVSDLRHFSHFKCFNAMIGWEESFSVDTAAINMQLF